jgi:hypothetical protein
MSAIDYGLKPLSNEEWKCTIQQFAGAIGLSDSTRLSTELEYRDYRFIGLFEQSTECSSITPLQEEIVVPVVVYVERDCIGYFDGKGRYTIYNEPIPEDQDIEDIFQQCPNYTNYAKRALKIYTSILVYDFKEGTSRYIKGIIVFENKFGVPYTFLGKEITKEDTIYAFRKGFEVQQKKLQSLAVAEQRAAKAEAKKACKAQARPAPYRAPKERFQKAVNTIKAVNRLEGTRRSARLARGVPQPQMDEEIMDQDFIPSHASPMKTSEDNYDQDLNDIIGGKYDSQFGGYQPFLFGRRRKSSSKDSVYRLKKMLKYINKLCK